MRSTSFLGRSHVGDVIEVRLQDTSFQTFFKMKVRVDDEKSLRQLVLDLRDKGVRLPLEEPEWL